MPPVVGSIEIARSPEDVFKYMDQLERHGEWQSQILSTTCLMNRPVAVGTRATDIRKTPMGKRDVTYEITEYEPPRKVSFRGVNGPVRPVGTVTIEGLGEGGSRVTLHLELKGHGLLGKLVAPMAQREARKQVPLDQKQLKERLEAGA